VYVGKIINYYAKPGAAEIRLESGDMKLGDVMMVQGPTTGVIEFMISSIQLDNKQVEKAKKGQNIAVKIPGGKARKNDKVYTIADA